MPSVWLHYCPDRLLWRPLTQAGHSGLFRWTCAQTGFLHAMQMQIRWRQFLLLNRDTDPKV